MDLAQKMDRMASSWEAAEDNRGIFLRCYCMMTENMSRALEKQRFIDSEWVENLLNRFAEYYFDALACYDCGEEVPQVWRTVHEEAGRDDLHVLQHLFLGVNAHINYDLVLTLYEILSPEWDSLTDQQKDIRYNDHMMVNTIIGETIDQVQDEVVETHAPQMDLVDKLLGRLDEKLISGLISKWRKSVWKDTLELLACEEEIAAQGYILEVEREVLRRAKWIGVV